MSRRGRDATRRSTSTASGAATRRTWRPHDPEAKLYRKAQSAPAKLHYLGQVLMEHRTGLPVDVEVTEANGFAEREAALTMLDRLPPRSRRTLAADKAYDTAEFVAALRERMVTPARRRQRRPQGWLALDGRTTRHAGYRASQRLRKRVEEIFGWGKDGRPMRKMKVAQPGEGELHRQSDRRLLRLAAGRAADRCTASLCVHVGPETAERAS